MAKKKPAKSPAASFEASLAQLEAIVAKLEGGQLGLADSLSEYEQGVKHLKLCYDQLTAAERRIELVTRVDASGKPQTEAFDDEASATLDKQGASRNRRRSAKSSTPKAKRRPSREVDDESSLF